jgi:hypothetical protein
LVISFFPEASMHAQEIPEHGHMQPLVKYDHACLQIDNTPAKIIKPILSINQWDA